MLACRKGAVGHAGCEGAESLMSRCGPISVGLTPRQRPCWRTMTLCWMGRTISIRAIWSTARPPAPANLWDFCSDYPMGGADIPLSIQTHGTPCYECVFPDRPAPGMVPTCAEVGVAAPLPGVIFGAMMAMEAVKHITGAGMTLRGRLLIHDALYTETRVIEITRRADCPVCGGSA